MTEIREMMVGSLPVRIVSADLPSEVAAVLFYEDLVTQDDCMREDGTWYERERWHPERGVVLKNVRPPL